MSKGDTPDIPELTQEDFFKMYRAIKKPLLIHLDSDIIAWLKSYGKGYQSRINNPDAEHRGMLFS